jgi:hypothetical protein
MRTRYPPESGELRFRGSKRRLRRIRGRDHIGWGFVLFVGWVLFLLLVAIPWVLSLHRHHVA